MALDEARLRFALYPTPHEAYGLCAVGLPQFKASGLAVAFDHTAPTFYRVSLLLPYKGLEFIQGWRGAACRVVPQSCIIPAVIDMQLTPVGSV